MRVVACFLSASLAACGHSADTESVKVRPGESITGTFGVLDGATGKTTPLVKVEAGEQGGSYLLYEYHNGQWVRPKEQWGGNGTFEPIKLFEKSDLEKLVHHKVDVDVSGLQTRGFALVHVPAGWSDNKGAAHQFKTNSGYFAMTLIGPVDLVRM